MSFSSENGYLPASFADIMDSLRLGINSQFGTSYTTETFVGTNWYKFCYTLAQKIQESEVKTSEIFAKLQSYFDVTNEILFKPASTPDGIIERLQDIGYTASVKPMVVGDAGKIYVCVDVDSAADDYATRKLAINTVLKNSVVGGVVTQGTESSSITLSNGQSFDFKFVLPNKIRTYLRLSIAKSANNTFAIASPDDTKLNLLANIAELYALGKNVEPDKYFSIADAPWAGSILLEWSIDAGANWYSTVISANYDDLHTFALADVTLVET